MKADTFKHIDPDEFHDKGLTLHDCVADQISFEDHTLRFYLPDGFWITPHHKASTCENVVRTDASVVEFYIDDMADIQIDVFTRHRWMGFRHTSVEYWDMQQLISKVNQKQCTIEFVTQYRTYGEQLWLCAIHSDKKPYYRDCYLHLPDTYATFYWNNLCLDREW